MKNRVYVLAMAGLMMSVMASARVVLPTHFTSNMVVQQQSTLKIKGQASPGSTVSLQTSWSRAAVEAKADSQGRFYMEVATPKASTKPQELTFNDGEELTLENVLVGEVWLGSGQSNMEMPVEGWGKVLNYEQEIANANYPMIRLLQVKKTTSIKPLEQAELNMGGWQECSPKYVPNFSALCYFYALRLWEELKVPVGIIDDDWGGTVAEAWTSPESLGKVTGFESIIAKYKELGFDKEAIRQYHDKRLADFDAELVRKDKGTSPGHTPWYSPDADDSGWSVIDVPQKWENVLGDVDGLVWYRRTVILPEDWAGKEVTIDLGVTDDRDITFWNGEEVGKTESMMVPSTYKIPGRLVKKGENVIAVRVMDTGGDGGLTTREASRFSLKQGSKTISLSGEWRIKPGLGLEAMPNTPPAIDNPNHPTVLYNAMINPLKDFPVRGIIWYQGCSNVGRDKQYEPLFQTLIHDWRKQFQQPDMPFYFVQLANYLAPSDLQPESKWALLRESQAKALCLPNTGMAVNIDLGDAKDIHPKTKRELGRRLAAIALHNTYGQKKTVFTAPVYKDFKVKDGKVHIYFSQPEGSEPLVQEDNLPGFIIQGPDLKWHVAQAKTVGDAEVVVSSLEVDSPIAVRYGWADNPTCTLRTKSDFHVAPFRTE